LETQRAKPSNTSSLFASLFLGRLGLGGIPHTLLAGTLVAGVGPSNTESSVSTGLDVGRHIALLDLLDGDVGRGNREGSGEERSLLELRDVGLGVTLLGGVRSAGKKDQSLLVSLEAGDVGGKGLLAKVLSAEIDGDSDGGSESLGDTGLL
jgi:hypothetical protein